MSGAAGGRWRLNLDGTRCDGHGICTLVCPERITLDQWGYAAIDDTVIAQRSTLARARRAVAACPAHALEVLEVLVPAPASR